MERVLHLTLKKRWFDMILSGEKKEEYREIKPYWERRLLHYSFGEKERRFVFHDMEVLYDFIIFRNGYSKNSRMMKVQYMGVQVGIPAFKWYGSKTDKELFVISLGEIVETKNLNPPKQ